MYFRYSLYCIILPILVIVTKGLLVQGSTENLTDVIHGFPGHNAADMRQTMQIMMQMLFNQTTEIDHLKQQTEKERSTIQMLQNRVFFLEAGQSELSKLPSSREFSTYLSGMKHLTENLLANEETDRNLTRQLNDAVAALESVKLKERSAAQQLRNQSAELENLKHQSVKDKLTIQQLNGSLTNVIRDVHDLIASMFNKILNYIQ